MKAAAARCIMFTTPMGLAFEYTKLFGARVMEVALIKLWGSLGISHAPILDWKDWAMENGYGGGAAASPQNLKTALDDVVYRHSEVGASDKDDESKDDDKDFELEVGSDEEGGNNLDLYLSFVEGQTAEPVENFLEALQEEEAAAAVTEEAVVSAAPNKEEPFDERPRKRGKFSDLAAIARASYADHKVELDSKDAIKSDGKKSVLIDDGNDIINEAVKALKDSLQSSAKQLLFQLECHE
jgi:hypothetical protein